MHDSRDHALSGASGPGAIPQALWTRGCAITAAAMITPPAHDHDWGGVGWSGCLGEGDRSSGAVIDAVRGWRAPSGAHRAPSVEHHEYRVTAPGRPARSSGVPPSVVEERTEVSEVKLSAVIRTEFGKGAARRLRRAHQVPAVIYGHGTAPVHVALPGHETMLALKQHNALLNLEIDGKTALTLPKAVQRDPIKGFIEHVDLLIVRRGERVTVDVSLHVTGDAAPGTLVNAHLTALAVEVEATQIPGQIEVSVAGAEAGVLIHAGEITLPAGATLVTDPEAIAVQVSGDTGDLTGGAEGEASEAAAEA
ncbi:MAG TPA: 50S ribosomal protein L25/general stress protein Ctc [Kineosporiaceae bacterium]